MWVDDRIREGDFVGITVMGTPNLILGSFKAATELLDARGNGSLKTNNAGWLTLLGRKVQSIPIDQKR